MKIFFSSLLFIVPVCVYAILSQDINNKQIYSYTGNIDNKYKINMNLVIKDNEISGSYFYHKYLQDIKLSGKILKKKQVYIEEFDNNGKVTAIFEGRFLDDSTEDSRHSRTGKLTQDVFEGFWYKTSNNNQKFPVYLQLEATVFVSNEENLYSVAGIHNDVLFESKVHVVLEAIKLNDKYMVEKYILYPLNVRLDDIKYKINNKTELYKMYDKIFTASFIKKINNCTPHKMFANYQGVMLGDGILWFSGIDVYIKAINN